MALQDFKINSSPLLNCCNLAKGTIDQIIIDQICGPNLLIIYCMNTRLSNIACRERQMRRTQLNCENLFKNYLRRAGRIHVFHCEVCPVRVHVWRGWPWHQRIRGGFARQERLRHIKNPKLQLSGSLCVHQLIKVEEVRGDLVVGAERIEWLIEDQAFLRPYDSTPLPSPVNNLSFFLSLPVCPRSSFCLERLGGGGGGWRESLVLY